MFNLIKEILCFYFWFITVSQKYCCGKNSSLFHKTKIFLISLYKGIGFCWITYFPPRDKWDEDHYLELIHEKNTIIKFLIDKEYIKHGNEYDDFIETLQVMYKLTE